MSKNRDNKKESDVTSTDDVVKNDVRENAIMRMNRRTFVKMAGVTAGAVALGTGLLRFIKPVMGVVGSLETYVDSLPIPPVATPGINMAYPGADYYEIPIVQATTHKFHRDLYPTNTYSYGADYLGPTIVAMRNKKVVIKFTNQLPTGQHLLTDAIDPTIMGSLDGVNADGDPWTDENRVCVHLHGGKVLPKFDGGPRDWFSPEGSTQVNPYPEAVDPGLTGSYTYEYSNNQPATMLWYHDHAWGITRFNPFAGLAAGYLLRDVGENALINNKAIPGGAYEIPIVIQDKLFNLENGAMIYPVADNSEGTHPIWIPEYFGDTPVVNGKAYPFLKVEPRRYRFRFLNGSNARFYNVSFNDPDGVAHPIWVIGSEQGFLPAPVSVYNLLLAPGERFDTIFDFTGMASGTKLTLMNDAGAPYPDGTDLPIPEIMQFKLEQPLSGKDKTIPPGSLKLPASFPPIATPPKPWREIVLSEVADPETGEPLEALLDGLHFTDTINGPPLFVEKANSVNVWQFINTTGDAHPMHTHLVPFKILDRQPFNVDSFTIAWDIWIAAGGRNQTAVPRPSIDDFLTEGSAYMPAPEETGWKDTAKAYPGEVLRIVTKFELPEGVKKGIYKYVCHCHILEHEENDMMFYWAVNKS